MAITTEPIFADSYFSIDVSQSFKRNYTLRAQSHSEHEYLDLLISFDICESQVQSALSIPLISLTLKQESASLTIPYSDYLGNLT